MKNKAIAATVIFVVIVIAVMYFVVHKSKTATGAHLRKTLTHTTYQAALSNDVIKSKNSSTLGAYLTEPNGQALYLYSYDSKGVSNCLGSCIANWPPYLDITSTTDLPANISTIKRSDSGALQFTYKGMPLYTHKNDANGRVTGNGVTGFRVANP